MYEIERKENEVIIRKVGHAVYTAPLESYIIYRSGDAQLVSKVKDLTDDKLLLALANAVEIQDFLGSPPTFRANGDYWAKPGWMTRLGTVCRCGGYPTRRRHSRHRWNIKMSPLKLSV